MSGYIYFIACRVPPAIKIGYTSKDPVLRLKQLQTGCPTELIMLGWYPGSMQDERELHRQMAAYRVSGEWFRFADPGVNDVLRGPFLAMQINNHLTGLDGGVFGS